MAFRMPLSLVVVLALAGALHGQRTITLHPVEVSGSVVQLAPPSVVIKSATGQQWAMRIDRSTSIKVTGTADPAMLTTGTCVRFTADIDKHTARAKDKIDKITIFTESPGVAERTLGVERAGSRPANEGQPMPGRPGPPGGFGPPNGPGGGPMGPGGMGPGGPGPGGPGPGGPGPGGPGQGGPGPGGRGQPGQQAGPDAPPDITAGDPAPADDGASSSKSAKRRSTAAKGPDKSVPDVASYDICAQIVSCHNGRMIVNVQNRFLKPRITAELAADAVIDLDLGNLAAVKPGDKVAALGFYLNPGVCEKTQVIEVALSNTLLPPGMRARKPRAVAKPDASHAAAAKTKANADATAGKKAPEAGASGKAPAKGPDELEVPPDMPPDQNAKPAQPKTKPPANPQEPPIKDDNVLGPLVDPAPEEKKPEAKKPVEKPQKAPPGKDDEKDVFDN